MIRPPHHLLTRGLFGPVFQREVRAVSRRTSSFWVRALYTLGLAVLASIIYFAVTAEIRFGGAGKASALQLLQMFAPTLGAFFAWFQFVIMCFVASTLTAGAICDERRKGSIASLLATPLTPAQIVLGKFAGRLVQLVILIAAGIPLLLAVRLFGGISSEFVLAATVLTISTAMVHASIALAASARVRSSTMAASSGFATGVGLCFAPMLLTLILAIGNNGPRTLSLLPFSPYFSLGWETARSLGSNDMPMFNANSWLYALGYNAAGCIFFLGLAVLRVRKLATGGEWSLPASSPRKRSSVQKTPANGVSKPIAEELTVWNNPLAWREFRQRLFMRPWQPWVVTIGVAFLLAFIYRESGIQSSQVFFVTSAIALALFYFQSALIASNSIAGERESRSLEALLTTPLTARAIIYAKWLGALRRVSPIAVLYFAIAFCFGVIPGTFDWVMLPHLALIVFPPVLFLIATGVWFSVITRRSTVAATLNLALGLMLWVVLPLIVVAGAGILSQFKGSSPPDEIFGVLAVWNPAPMVVTAIQGADWSRAIFGPHPSYNTFFHFSLWSFTACATVFALVYALLARAALHGATRALARRTNRDG
ncbi:MAG: ABC transporter permease subunit [Phycisphaeraceae bacterium]|nr:ABC transporter permease subunit [Phycisphaeraceae bacterium]